MRKPGESPAFFIGRCQHHPKSYPLHLSRKVRNGYVWVQIDRNYNVELRVSRTDIRGRSCLFAGAVVSMSLLGGCSSIQNQAEATVAPPLPRAGYASLNIGRPMGSNVSIFPLAIHVDGKPAISLSPGQYTTIEIAPGNHSIGVPNGVWNQAIAGTPHAAEFVTEPGKTYYALPTQWYVDDGYRVSLVGSVAVSHRTAAGHSSFAIQSAGAPAEFTKLTYVKAP
jgi:hypothetical protein